MLVRERATKNAVAIRKQHHTKAAGTRVGTIEEWRSSGAKADGKKLSRTASVRDGR